MNTSAGPFSSKTKRERRVAVTGGATNIGRAISLRYLRGGAKVAIGQPDVAVIAPLEAAYPEQVVPLPLSLENPQSCRDFVESAAAAMGGLDVLVNNAALSGPTSSRPFLEMDDAFIDRIIEVNLKGVIRCSVAAARLMKEAGGGTIIHITSINAVRPQWGASAYAAAKAGLASLTQSMAKELASSGIRVVAVAPGDIRTDQYEAILKQADEAGMKNDVVGQTPLGQGTPDDVAATVYFLGSAEAGFITGTTFLVDGGLLA